MDKVARDRSEKLPNETGGVLIGARDTKRRIVYVVESLPSPLDSTEWPTVYIRGKQGLRRRLEEIRQITGNHLGYIGEWHSHPRGHSPSPSSDDHRAFQWLSDMLALEGLPATMLIVGESESAWHVGHMT
jgi:integrative and conjugative element protein (TIGR02256 family)